MMCPVFYTHNFFFLSLSVCTAISCGFFFFNRHLEEDMITAELYKPASNYVKRH